MSCLVRILSFGGRILNVPFWVYIGAIKTCVLERIGSNLFQGLDTEDEMKKFP